MNKIIVYGAGYVGLANGLLLARQNEVTIVDINQNIINMLNNKEVHIDDDGCKNEIKNTNSKFKLLSEVNANDFDYVILAVPTNYDENLNAFDTSILDKEFENLDNINFKGIIIIKSTIPLWYTEKQIELHPKLNIVFSPEFLREGSSFNDALNPSRIIVGGKDSSKVIELFKKASQPCETITMSTTEAEAVKLFSNTYLAMRVAFVNELSTFARTNKINENNIIKGVSLDPRIGSQYFSPSIGYGGYCLPKDSKQLRYEFVNKKVPNSLFDAIVESNEKRKQFIADEIIASGVKEYIIEGLGHKPGVNNYRNSPKLDLAKKLRSAGINVILKDEHFEGQVIDGFKVIR